MRCSLCSSGPPNSRQKSWTNQIVFTLAGRCVTQVRSYHCIVYPRVHCAVQFSALGYTTPVCKIITVSSASSCSSWCHRWLLILHVCLETPAHCALSSRWEFKVVGHFLDRTSWMRGRRTANWSYPYHIRACIALSSRVPQGKQHLNLNRPPPHPSRRHSHIQQFNLWCTFMAIAKQVIPCRSKITYNASS